MTLTKIEDWLDLTASNLLDDEYFPFVEHCIDCLLDTDQQIQLLEKIKRSLTDSTPRRKALITIETPYPSSDDGKREVNRLFGVVSESIKEKLEDYNHLSEIKLTLALKEG